MSGSTEYEADSHLFAKDFWYNICSIVRQISKLFDHSDSNVTLKLVSSVIKNTRIQDKSTTCRDILNFWKVGTVKMGKNLKNQNSLHEEIKLKLKPLLSFDTDLLSSSLLSKNLKIKIYRTVILPVILYGCETWSLTLREKSRLRVFKNRVLRKIFGFKRDEITGMENTAKWGALWSLLLTKCYSGDQMKNNETGRHVASVGAGEVHTGFWWGDMRERDHLEDLGVDGENV